MLRGKHFNLMGPLRVLWIERALDPRGRLYAERSTKGLTTVQGVGNLHANTV
jgi:hypothetical protein